jgi:hypothetical protein
MSSDKPEWWDKWTDPDAAPVKLLPNAPDEVVDEFRRLMAELKQQQSAPY